MPTVERLLEDKHRRTGPREELTTSTYQLVAENADDKELATELVRALHVEEKNEHHQAYALVSAWLTLAAEDFGEEEVNQVLRRAPNYFAANLFPATMSQQERIERWLEIKRRQRGGPGEWGDVDIVENEHEYIIGTDPCGSGGWLMRLEQEYGPQRYNGRTKDPQPLSWGKAGVTYYCTHCCVPAECKAVETTGYIRLVTECPSDAPDQPCIQHQYKHPDAIPAVFYERIGAKKPPVKVQA
jgi:hypothetical protein